MDAEPSGAAEVFGAALRALRKRASLSLRQLGQQALYDYTRISRAERGLILIPAPQVRVLDEVLHAGGLLIALRQAAGSPAAELAGSCSVSGGGSVIVEVRLPGGGSISVSLSRRGFGQLIAAGAVTAAIPGARDLGGTSGPVYAVRQPSRVDDQILGYFRRALAEFYTADKMLGPRSLIGPVLAQVSVLDELRRGASARYTDPVLQVLAQYGEMAGWLLQDAGDLDAAAGWSARAAQWAQCAGDTNLAAYMLVRQANIAVLTGDQTAVVQFAAGARRDQARLEPKLTALALQQQARGHARLGEFSECFTLLDQATSTLAAHPEVSQPGVPVYLHNYDLGTLREQSAACHLQAGHAAEAITILETALAESDPGLLRDRGHLTAKLAVAVARSAQPEPDRAATLGMDALDTARETGSARIMRELAKLDQALHDRWPGHRPSRELREAIACSC